MKVEINKKGKAKIKVHSYDVWNADGTLAKVILPVLKKFKKQNIGYPGELLPVHYHSYSEDMQKELDDTAAKEWDKIIDSMIWSFEQVGDDNYFGLDNGVYNPEKRKAKDDRVQNGLNLFGRYFRNLWI